MSRHPGSTWRPVDRYQSGSLKVAMTPRRLILHTAVSNATPSMHSYFNVSGRATSHFYVGRDGEGEQYIDTDYRSTANLEGNPDCITVESWDGYAGAAGWQPPPWTDAQLEWLADLAAWCHAVHGIPLVQLPSSAPGTQGIGWHRQGIDGNFPTGLLAGRVTGGETWSSSGGKVCPGDNRIEQIPAIIIPRARDLTEGDEEDMPTLAEIKEVVQAETGPIKQALSSFRENERGRDAADQDRDEQILAAIDGLPDGSLSRADVRTAVGRVLTKKGA